MSGDLYVPCPVCGKDIWSPKLDRHIEDKHPGYTIQAQVAASPDGEVPTVAGECPFCKGEVAEDAQKCRHCGEWIGAARAARDSDERRRNLLIGLALAIAAVVVVVVFYVREEDQAEREAEDYVDCVIGSGSDC